MGHDNTDKDIKHKLEQRTIQPSSESWDKLSIMLDEQTEKRGKKGYFKYAFAASVLLLLGFFFASEFKGNQDVIIKEEIVEIENEGVDISIDEDVKKTIIDQYNKEEVVAVQKKETLEEVVIKETTYAYVESLDMNQAVSQEEEIDVLKEKVKQYLGQLEKNKKEKFDSEKTGYDIDAEINALLAEASSAFPDKTIKNDIPVFQLDKETDMLLADAFQELNFDPKEDTVNETLKDKLFKELEKGYFKSKVLLAERRNLARPKEYTSIY